MSAWTYAYASSIMRGILTYISTAMNNIYPYRGILPQIADNAFIAPSADIIGDVTIGEQSGIWFHCTVRGDVNDIRIGKRTNIQDNTVIHVSSNGQGTYIGDDVTVGHCALLHACTIEDGAFIGLQACIMDDALVEKGAMVAAGALVTPGKTVKTGEVWAGSPAKKLRDIKPEDLVFFQENIERYCGLAQEYSSTLIKK